MLNNFLAEIRLNKQKAVGVASLEIAGHSLKDGKTAHSISVLDLSKEKKPTCSISK